MTDIDALPADQRAALQLLLKQKQTYDQLASLLGIGADAVRGRAHTAIDTLGGNTDLSEAECASVADFLLGQQSGSDRDTTSDLIAGSPSAQAWARDVSNALRPLAGDALPAIPTGAAGAEAEAPAREPEPAPYEEAEPAPYEREPVGYEEPETAPYEREPVGFEAAPYEEPEPPSRARAKPPAPPRPSSRLGGALLLGGLGIIVAVVLILIINGGGDDKPKSGSTLSSNPSTQTNAGQQRPIAQINLASDSGDPGQVGLAQVFENGNRRAIIVAGQGLKPGAYALWLYNSKSDAKLLGFVPERVGKDGRFATQGELPSDAEKYERLVVTKEKVTKNTKKAPSKPGSIVLQGDVKLD